MVATYQISQPESFDFANPEEWQRFEQFHQASGLTEKSKEGQVNSLMYCVGDRADDILRSFKLSDKDSKKYEVVKNKFNMSSLKHQNMIFK